MIGVGFNPIPNISLGDMQDIFDIESEIDVIELDLCDSKKNEKPPVDTDRILKQFSIPNNAILNTQGNNSSSESIKSNTPDNTCIQSEEEKELLERLRIAEENKKAEEEKALRLRRLQEEAARAEQEAQLAKQKREEEEQRLNEQKQRQIREEQERIEREKEEKRREEERRKEEQHREEIRRAQEELDRQREQLRLEQLRMEQDRIRAEQERVRAEQAELDRLKAARDAEKLRVAQAREAELARIQRENEIKTKQENERLRQEKIKLLLAAKSKKEEEERRRKQLELVRRKESEKYERYDSLDIDALYKEVRVFLKVHNIEKSIIDTKLLENEFGKNNVKKLLLKAYLIQLGKGVTVGR